MELFGPNSWLTGMYLAALKAGAEMAEHLGDAAAAAEYRAIFTRGKAWADANLFNGKYYIQRIDPWPAGATKPTIPAPYSQETMNGFEYAAASHMIMNGLVDEGMICVEALRRRYDGERRNPWNEFECGSNYARSMASYALLNAFAGFQFDMVRQEIGFRPVRLIDGCFRCFWSLDSGWGEFELTPTRAEVRLCSGRLDLTTLRLPEECTVRSVHVGAAAVTFTYAAGKLRLDEGVRLSVDAPLTVELLAPGA